MTCGIYKLTNIFNGKIYIGGSNNAEIRFSAHIGKLKRNVHENEHMQRSFNKSWNNPFIFEIIEECNIKDLIVKEQHWIDVTNCCDPEIGYNIFKFARSALGYKQSEEHKRKISLANKGKIISLEVKEKISKKNKGYRHTEEVKKIISLASKGNKHTFGRKLTEEHKMKVSVALKGRKKDTSRDFDKWPHELGSKCKCEKCYRKTQDRKNLRKVRRTAIKNNNYFANGLLSFGT